MRAARQTNPSPPPTLADRVRAGRRHLVSLKAQGFTVVGGNPEDRTLDVEVDEQLAPHVGADHWEMIRRLKPELLSAINLGQELQDLYSAWSGKIKYAAYCLGRLRDEGFDPETVDAETIRKIITANGEEAAACIAFYRAERASWEQTRQRALSCLERLRQRDITVILDAWPKASGRVPDDLLDEWIACYPAFVFVISHPDDPRLPFIFGLPARELFF